MKILVCGGRDFGDLQGIIKIKEPELYAKRLAQNKFVSETLNELAEKYSSYYNPNDNWLPTDITIIEGGACGADRCAEEWAIINYCTIAEFQADWTTHGKAAGPIRNKRMLDEGKPDLVVAFPGGKGTANMVQSAKAAGVKVLEVEYEKG